MLHGVFFGEVSDYGFCFPVFGDDSVQDCDFDCAVADGAANRDKICCCYHPRSWIDVRATASVDALTIDRLISKSVPKK